MMNNLDGFILIKKELPTVTGTYMVLTSIGNIITCYFENVLGNMIWETEYEYLENEVVIAWKLINECDNIYK